MSLSGKDMGGFLCFAYNASTKSLLIFLAYIPVGYRVTVTPEAIESISGLSAASLSTSAIIPEYPRPKV